MAKTLNVSRADAYTAVADVWAMLAADAEGDIVKGWTLEMLDAVVEGEVAGCGAAMLQAGLVGVVDDGLVLPAELRRHERAERDGPAAAAVARGSDDDERTRRRREQNRAASRKYRRTNRVTGSKATPSGDKKWRTLGRVAGHEVRVFDGPHGCYAILLGATINGQLCKLTTGDKAWSLESVRLVDTLPGLLKKWEHKRNYAPFDEDASSRVLVPSFAEFRDDAERLTMLAKLQAAEADAARHADGADASSRHADASASSAGPSAELDADCERKSFDDMGLGASAASADRHADALSSMSSLSKSSSFQEEDMETGGREAAGDHERDEGDAEPAGMAAWDQKRRRKRMLAEKFSAVLGEDVETILHRWNCNRLLLRLQLERAGIDPNTGDPVAAGASSKSARARADIQATTEPTETDKPAAGSVGARGGDEPDEDFEAMKDRLAGQLRGVAVAAAADVGVKYA